MRDVQALDPTGCRWSPSASSPSRIAFLPPFVTRARCELVSRLLADTFAAIPTYVDR